ncbi:MAG: glycosyltransferase family 2 protein [Candidatus Woesearchaeota archaeon]
MKTIVVIPAHNEATRIKEVLKAVKKIVKDVIVVDDGSQDNTASVAQEAKVIVLRHITNLGKGAALKTGCDYAIQKGAENIIVMDADGQHRAKDIPRFLNALKSNDVVFGTRKGTKKMPVLLRIGNWGLNTITRIFYGIKIHDTQCGFRAFTRDAYKKIRWEAQNYDMESEMIARAGKAKLKYAEIPIETIYLDKYKGTTVLDGIKIGLKLIAWRLQKWS